MKFSELSEVHEFEKFCRDKIHELIRGYVFGDGLMDDLRVVLSDYYPDLPYEYRRYAENQIDELSIRWKSPNSRTFEEFENKLKNY